MDTHLDDVARVCGALSDPTRVAIVARLAHGEATVKELTEPFDLTQQAVSRHLKVLEESGLISRRRQAQARPAQLEIARLVEILGWMDDQRQIWQQRHQRLGEHLARIQSGEREPRRDQ